MERRAKERLIGASILVVLVVLVVPELLSGPKPPKPSVPLLPAPSSSAPEPTRTVTVDLATSKSTSAESDGGAVDSVASASAPAPTTSPADAAPAVLSDKGVAEEAKPLSSNPPPAPSRAVDSSVAAPMSGRDWSVQLGSFANRANADHLVHQLKSQGFPVYDSASGAGRAQRFRVRVGPLSDRAAADRTLAKLKVLGHAASVVPPAKTK